MTKYLGIDYGLERTGLAISDPDGKLAFPLRTLALGNFRNRSELLDALGQIARSNQVQEVVIGLPLNDDGSENLTCRQIRNFAARLTRRLPLPLHFMPENFSSIEARGNLKACGVIAGKIKAVLDQQAACLILESFLNRQETSP